MALFFDKNWFDAALAKAGLARGDLARTLGLGEAEIAELWKDQRELSAREVAAIAILLKVPAEEVADRAGVSTPVPRATPADPAALGEAMAEFAERLARVERTLSEIKALMLDLRREG
jgi:transcriptional regulator with XRE-family HTH domain